MPSVNQNIVDDYKSVRESITFSARDQENLSKAFADSPIYKDQMSDSSVRQQFIELCQKGTVTSGFGLDSFNRDFVDAPNLEDVDTSLKGVGTPYMPNLNSPGEANGANPMSLAPYTGNRGLKENAPAQWGSPGSTGLVSPSVTSPQIASQTLEPIGDLIGPITPAGAAQVSKSYNNSQIPEEDKKCQVLY